MFQKLHQLRFGNISFKNTYNIKVYNLVFKITIQMIIIIEKIPSIFPTIVGKWLSGIDEFLDLDPGMFFKI